MGCVGGCTVWFVACGGLPPAVGLKVLGPAPFDPVGPVLVVRKVLGPVLPAPFDPIAPPVEPVGPVLVLLILLWNLGVPVVGATPALLKRPAWLVVVIGG